MRSRVAVYAVLLVAGLSVLRAPASAQKTGQTSPSPTTPSPSPTTPGTRTPVPTSPGTQQPSTSNQQGTMQDLQRPIFLNGKVLVEDGTPPPESVLIERVCNGVARPQGYTDSKGRFSFQLGQDNMMFADASVGTDTGFGRQSSSSGGPMSSNVNERDLWGCDLQASLAGYTSSLISLAGRRAFEDPNVGTIVLHRFGKVEGTTISMTSLQAPKDAQKALEKGRDAMKKEKWQDAEKQFEKAVGIYPQYAAAWYESGRALERLNDPEGARAAYAKSLAADPKYVNPYVQLAGIAAQQKQWQVLRDTTDRGLKLDSFNYPGLHYLNAVAEYNLQHVDAAEQSARETLKLDTQQRYPSANHLLGVILARKGDYKEAAEFLRAYIKLAPTAANIAAAKKQLADIETMAKVEH